MARRTIKLWQLILAGPFLFWIGCHEYNRLDDLEQHGGVLYVDRFTKLFYDLGGKNTVLLVWGAFGAFYVWALLRWLQAHRHHERTMEAIEAREAARDQPVARPKPAPREAPPRLGDDPFREPPRPAPVRVIRDEKPAQPTPIVAGNSDDEPKLLK